MTDYEKRQILALAAKAYGAAQHPETGPWEYFFELEPGGNLEFKKWNPLEDDGDCARLAAAVEIDTHFRVVGSLRVEALPPGGPLVVQTYAKAAECMQAWRFAVVRAAAYYQSRVDHVVSHDQ